MNELKKVHVLIFYPHIGEYGGIERNIVALTKQALLKGKNPVLLCYYDLIDMGKYAPGLEVVQMGEHRNPWLKAKRLSDWINHHSEKTQGLAFVFGGKAGFYAGLMKDVPYVLHYTDPPSLLSSNKQQGLLKKLLAAPRSLISDSITKLGVTKAEKCITMTNWNAKELHEVYGRKFQVVHQGGVPPNGKINTGRRLKNAELGLFSICRITKSKKLDWILQVTKYLSTTAPYNEWFTGFKVVIAGKGPEQKHLVQLSKDLGIAHLVFFPGFLTADEVEAHYANADLFLVPGKQGFGLPVLEALYRHLPVVLNVESRVSEILGDHPWAAISEDELGSFIDKTVKHIQALRNSYPDEKFLHELPTEAGWANKIGEECNWW